MTSKSLGFPRACMVISYCFGSRSTIIPVQNLSRIGPHGTYQSSNGPVARCGMGLCSPFGRYGCADRATQIRNSALAMSHEARDASLVLASAAARTAGHAHHHVASSPHEAQIVVTINPEARVSAVRGASLPHCPRLADLQPRSTSRSSSRALLLRVFGQPVQVMWQCIWTKRSSMASRGTIACCI